LLDVEAQHAAAAALWRLSTSGERLPELPDDLRPTNLAEGWAIQRALDAWAGPRVGWKVASTSRPSQERLGVDEPLAGALYERDIVPNHSTVAATYLGIVEGEFAFRMRGGLDLRRAPFTREMVLACVATVYPGAEAPDSRLSNYPRVSAPQLVADFMLSRYYAIGDPLAVSPSELLGVEVVIRHNGVEVKRGTGSDVLGDPCNVLVWLANELAARGEEIREGDLVTTGACALASAVTAGDTVTATFDGNGVVSISFAAKDAERAMKTQGRNR
jgi:2-keto-4-pentenoate hydratase